MMFAKGYRIIRVPIGVGMASHNFFLKDHSDARKETNGRTLFVGNAVDFCGERVAEDVDAYMRDFFGMFGEVESISVSSFGEDSENIGERNSRFVHVLFAKKSSLRAALAAPDSTYHSAGVEMAKRWGTGALRKRSRAELALQFKYEHESLNDIKSDVHNFMKDFEESEELAKSERERLANQVDDDGFIPVKHRKKRSRTEEKRGSGKQRSRAPKKNLELKNFYRFQMREQKKEKLLELRQKFEEDKLRIAAMKASRQFKPF